MMHIPGLKEALARLDTFEEVVPLLESMADNMNRVVDSLERLVELMEEKDA